MVSESPRPGAGLLFRKEAKARAVLGLAGVSSRSPCRRAKAPVWAAFPFIPGRRARHTLRVPCGRLEPGSGPAHARNRGGPRCAMMRCGRQMRWLEGVWWRKAPASEHGRALCGGDSGGRGGASAGEGRWLREGFLVLRGLRVPQLKPIRIWISMGSGIASSRRGDFFLEKKQKRARCSGLPSRFILCRTCRAKAACLGGVSVCTPGRRARHALRAPCGTLESGSGPAHARIGMMGSKGRTDAERANAAA